MDKILLLSALIFALTFMSCDSMFDNELPPHSLVGENAIVDETSAEVALNGVYSYFAGYGPMSAYYISDNEFRTGLLNPNYYYRSKWESDQLPELRVEEDNSNLEAPWRQIYRIVNTASNFIHYTEKLPAGVFAPGKQNNMLAEARFARAFAHAYSLRAFGYFWDIDSEFGTIVRMEPASLSNNYQARSTVKESYEKIFEDLDYAIQYGPAYYTKFRGCATAAKAFKADILMNRGAAGDYAEAIRLADEVIGSSEFGMEETYADVFNKGYNSKELLFTRFIKDPPNVDYNSGTMIKMFCGGVFQPTDAYMNVFSDSDPRKDWTFATRTFTNTTGDYERIIWPKHDVGKGDCPMYYMRVAQMYLIKAEAMVYTGSPVEEVVKVLNILRTRAGAPLLEAADFPDREGLLEEIFHENIREIGSENGALYYLAVRMRIGGERLLKKWNENYTKDDQLCFPVPLIELEHNFKVKQKPF